MGRPVRHTANDVKTLSMLMLAEARGEGVIGMNMVGTVVVNRVNANCAPDFKGLRTIPQVVYQTQPGRPHSYHFQPVTNGSLYTQRPRPTDIQRARALTLGYSDPRAREALWFFNPSWGSKYRIQCTPQMPASPMTRFITAYKHHCFYAGAYGYCKEFYR